ncbi:MAG TPA: hypothetical protein VFQ61_31400 [Polyangiaceae bacterium]|nr:hypothetical protein [Polyangiaceae bacterium]
MSYGAPGQGPPRLADDPRFSALFREADRSFAESRDEIRDFARLRSKLGNGRRLSGFTVYGRWAMVGVVALVGFIAVRRAVAPAPVEVARENVWRPRSAADRAPKDSRVDGRGSEAPRASEVVDADGMHTREDRASEDARAASGRVAKKASERAPSSELAGNGLVGNFEQPASDESANSRPPLVAQKARLGAGEAAQKPDSRNPPSSSASAPDCLSFAREGRPQDADACFMQRGAGSGLAAEVSLYEAARLRRDVLGDPQAALQTLSLYRTRFPSGSLRSEVDMSYLELLSRAGRDAEALAESARLLQSVAGNERFVELHALRGNIFRKGKDLRAAEREYGFAERGSGALAREAAYLRGTCLQSLGEDSAARAAFERYLAKGAGPRERDIRQRLLRLVP